MGIEDGVKLVHSDHGHDCLTKIVSPQQSILVLRFIEAIDHTRVGFEAGFERAVKSAARDELVQCFDWSAWPERSQVPVEGDLPLVSAT